MNGTVVNKSPMFKSAQPSNKVGMQANMPPSPNVKAVESLPSDLLAQFFTDVSSTKQLIETYRFWLVRCGPIRVAHETITDLVSWKNVDATCLMIVIVVGVTFYPNVLLPLLFLLTLIGIPYLYLLSKTAAITHRLPPTEDFNANLNFNHWFMGTWCSAYDRFRKMDPVQVLRKGVISGFGCAAVVCIVPSRYLPLLGLSLLLLYNFPSRRPKVLIERTALTLSRLVS
jgi:hypothetical protein